MAAGIWMAIFGLIFYYLKYLYDRKILKKSKDEVLLEQLNQEYLDSFKKWNLLKSKEKVKKEEDELLKRISDLEEKIKNDKFKNNH